MRMPRTARRLCLGSLCLALVLAGCTQGTSTAPMQPPVTTPQPPAVPTPPPPPAEPPVQLSDDVRDNVLFTLWRPKHPEVETFGAFLVSESVADVVPMYQLLRSASMWKECNAEPFEVPPESEWEKVRDVLILLRDLRQRGVLPTFEVVSAYRDPRLNRCAGGAPGSSHQHFAVDIAPLAPEVGARLCRFWREQGRQWDMGVSRYPTGRIHIDRTGYRTWGASHKRASSYCLGEA